MIAIIHTIIMNTNSDSLRSGDVSLRKVALTAGVALALMTLIAPFANFYVLAKLIVAGDGASTAENILAAEGLFRLGAISLLVVVILDIIVAWGLWVLLIPVNKSLSLLAAWFRIIYAAIFAVAIANLFHALEWVNSPEYLQVFEPGQIHAQVLLSVETFQKEWDLGLIIFGCHLLVLGFLLYKADFVPRVIGILVVIAGAGYFVNGFIHSLYPGANTGFLMFTFIGEVVFLFWLLIKGPRLKDPE